MLLPENAQTIAGLVALVSIALFTVEVLILPKMWEKLNPYLFNLSREKRVHLAKITLFVIGLPIILMGVYTIAGVYDPKHVDSWVFITMFLITLVLVLTLSVRGLISLLRSRKSKKVREKVEELPLLFVTGFAFIVIGMMSNLVALFGVSAAMLGIETGIYNVENYNWGRWFMMDAVYFSVCGIVIVGVAYLCEKVGARPRHNT